MTLPPSPRGVLVFRPRPADIVKQVRALAANTPVGFSRHARDRMEQRGITDREAIKVLQLGELEGDIEPGNARGEWKCKMVAPIKGSREVGVVTLLLVNARLLVKTVEWEDP